MERTNLRESSFIRLTGSLKLIGYLLCTAILLTPLGKAPQAAALTAGDVTFQITGAGNGTPAVLDSITLTAGGTVFSELISPDNVNYQFLNPAAGSQYIVEPDGTSTINVLSGPVIFDPALISVNADRDITRYLGMDTSITSTDFVEFLYNTPLTSGSVGFIMISERAGNNGMTATALDAGSNPIGNAVIAVPGGVGTYISTGIAEGKFGQDVRFTIYPLSDLVAPGTQIHGIRLTQTGAPGGGGDGGDGKVFIIADPAALNGAPVAVDDGVSTPLNTTIAAITVLGNDSDPDTDPLTVSNITIPASSGTATINPDNATIEYVPNVGFIGTDTFVYEISDGNGGTDTATVTVTVTDPNSQPVAVDDAASTPLNTTIAAISVLDNDSDPDTDPLTVTGITVAATSGTATVNPDNATIQYIPNPGFIGTDTFEYSISDGTTGTDTATVTVTVTNEPNVDPVAVDDTSSTPFNTAVDIDVVGNDTDGNAGDTLSVDSFTQPANGTVTQNGDGTLKFTPDAGFTGIDTFTYDVTDGTATDTATVTVTVDPNTPPTAADDSVTTPKNTATTFPVLGNDSANDAGQTLSIVSNTDPANGVAVDNGNGTFTYTPDAGFEGVDTFTYTITDGSDTATATVTITVPGDFDNDGIPDDVDIDDDNDGILDSVEGTGDFDGDGTPNHLDLDADGDGILDMEESGLNEAQQASLDTDGDGQIDPGNSFGLNGLADDIETAPESGTPDYSDNGTADSPLNSDATGDTQPDFLDLDSDNDGITDVIEAGFTDADGDGEMDSGQTPTMSPVNSDTDPLANYRDLDSDNDGLTDIIEAGLSDADKNGLVDNFQDNDGDGYDDTVETSPAPVPNTDGDTVPDYLDLDSDNDGITDTTEGGLLDVNGDGLVDDFADLDGDGYDDATTATPAPIPNTDDDSVPNYLDLDSDNDGVTDATEAGLNDTNGNGEIENFTDANGDGLDDATTVSPAPRPDTDDDGIVDVLDLDSDNDGVTDTIEAGLADADGDGHIDNFTDTDGDGYDDATTTSPAPLPDTDNDGAADIHDLDSDNDGITDTIEAGLEDVDGDGHIDNFTDADGDGYDDATTTSPAPIPDTDSDGTPDIHDLDSDNDEINDVLEAGLADENGDGLVDDFVDADGDGYDDSTEINPAPLLDENGNGIPDFRELDCDCTLITGVDGHGGSMNWMALLLLALLGVTRLIPTRITRNTLATLALLFAGIPMAASADNSPDEREFDNRFYLGAGLGITKLEPESSCGCEKVDDDSDSGYQLFLGYDLSKRLSLEGYYADLGEAGIATKADVHEGEVSYEHYGISLLGYLFNSRGADDFEDSNFDDEGLFRREGLSGFARVGVGAMDNSSAQVAYENENSAHLHLGAGLEYGWANGFAARAEYISYDTDAKLLSISLLKRFGDVRKPVTEKAKPAPVQKPAPVVKAAPVPPPAPAPVVAAPAVCQNQVLDGVTFHTASATLTSEATAYLDTIAATLRDGACSSITVVGHTDSRGSDAYNRNLSNNRAKSVAVYLETHGVHKDSLQYTGKGEKEPRSSNNTAEGRALNRRVELIVK